MKRLCNLQFCEAKIKKLSIRDDYTEEERLIVKTWIEEAKQRNERECVNKWVVRGPPRKEMRLVQRLANQHDTVQPPLQWHVQDK